MTFKSATQPHCRWCGVPIRKDSRKVYFHTAPTPYHQQDSWIGYAYVGERPWPRSREEAQPFVNQQIISIAYERIDGRGRKAGDVYSVNVWDGESYADEFFCKGDCARAMGYAAARGHGLATKAWREATGRTSISPDKPRAQPERVP